MSTDSASDGSPSLSGVSIVLVDDSNRNRIATQCPSWAAHLRSDQGFSLIAVCSQRPVGIVTVKWQKLPEPLPPSTEGYIDIIEVHRPWRRRGIARSLVEVATSRARANGAVQLRAWSTNDKVEAIPTWLRLGFTLCPVTHSMWKQTQVTGFFVAKRLD